MAVAVYCCIVLFNIYIYFLEIVKVRTQRRRREQLPPDCPAEDVAIGKDIPVSAVEPVPNSYSEEKENVTLLSEVNVCPLEEEPAPSAERDVPNVPMSQDKPSTTQPVKERKRVRIAEEINDTQTLSKKDCAITSISPRSVTPPVLEHRIQERPRSFICRFVNCAIRLFLYFLSFAWCLFPIFRLPRLKIFSPFKKS